MPLRHGRRRGRSRQDPQARGTLPGGFPRRDRLRGGGTPRRGGRRDADAGPGVRIGLGGSRELRPEPVADGDGDQKVGKRSLTCSEAISSEPWRRLTSRAPTTLGPSLGARKSAVFRLRSRYRALSRGEIAATLADPTKVDAEPWELTCRAADALIVHPRFGGSGHDDLLPLAVFRRRPRAAFAPSTLRYARAREPGRDGAVLCGRSGGEIRITVGTRIPAGHTAKFRKLFPPGL